MRNLGEWPPAKQLVIRPAFRIRMAAKKILAVSLGLAVAAPITVEAYAKRGYHVLYDQHLRSPYGVPLIMVVPVVVPISAHFGHFAYQIAHFGCLPRR